MSLFFREIRMPSLPICTDWTSDDYDVYEADDSTDDESWVDEETCQKSRRDFWNSHESTRTVREDNANTTHVICIHVHICRHNSLIITCFMDFANSAEIGVVKCDWCGARSERNLLNHDIMMFMSWAFFNPTFCSDLASRFCYIHLFWLAKKCGWQTAWDMQVGR